MIQSTTEVSEAPIDHPGGEIAAHTPGPWEYGAGDDYYIRAQAYPKSFPHRFKSDDLGDYLAYVGNRTSDFGEANARLIASAPELLEALEECASRCRYDGDLFHDQGNHQRRDASWKAADAATAAISKAKGKTP